MKDGASARSSHLRAIAPFVSSWRNRHLIVKLVTRDLASRYRGSFGGVAWALAQPLAMLAVYSFVFSVVLRTRWPVDPASANTNFTVILFSGLIVYGLFADCILRAPGLIVAHTSFVKKVVFPLEILPVMVMGSGLFLTSINLVMLFVAMVLTGQTFHWTVLLIPFVLLPLALMTLGISWLLAALGVFLRDIGQVIGLVVTAMMFLAPILYPLTAVPEAYRPLFLLNPLTFPVEQARKVLIFGQMPDWSGLVIYTALGWLFAVLGFAFFQRIRKGFADVL
jgi:lipopolysaccharide transport system permease protein